MFSATSRPRLTSRCLRPWTFVLLGLSLVQVSRADEATEATQLISNFSAGCGTQGEWTHAALGYTQSLIMTLNQLANDPDCRTINGALSHLQSINTQLANLTQDADQRQLASLKKQEELLLLEISRTTDTSRQSSLMSSLQSVEVQLAQYQGQSVEDHSFQDTQRQGRSLQTLVTGTNLLLQQSLQNQVCLEKNPSLLSGLASLAGSVEAVATTGGSSLVVSAGADLLNGVIESERVRRLERRINRMASSITASAYSCVLETLSNQWCTSKDALQIVRLEGNSLASPISVSPLGDAIQLLNRDLALFLNWLNSVRSGTDPANAATASRQSSALDRDRLVRSGRSNALGVIAENRALFDLAGDDPGRWQIVKQTISTIAAQFLQSNCSNSSCPYTPMGDVLGGSEAGTIGQWYLIGVSDDQIPRDQNGKRKSLDSYSWNQIPTVVGDPSFKPNLAVVKGNMFKWINLARDRVNAELAIVLNLDPLQLVMNATSPNLRGDSPYKSLQKILVFLRNQDSGSAAVGSFSNLYANTIDRLSQVGKQIELIANARTDDPNHDPAAALTEIYSSAKLDNGVGFLGDRLRWALQLSINRMVTTSRSGLSDSQAALLLATHDIVSELQSYNGNTELQPISRDIENSQVIIERTVSNFVDEFGGGISQSLKDYDRQARDLNEGPDGTSRKAAAELCLKLLAAPTWPRKVSRDLCKDRNLPSMFDGGPASVTVNADSMALPYGKRVCSFRDYNRSNYLYQNILSRRDR